MLIEKNGEGIQKSSFQVLSVDCIFNSAILLSHAKCKRFQKLNSNKLFLSRQALKALIRTHGLIEIQEIVKSGLEKWMENLIK